MSEQSDDLDSILAQTKVAVLTTEDRENPVVLKVWPEKKANGEYRYTLGQRR